MSLTTATPQPLATTPPQSDAALSLITQAMQAGHSPEQMGELYALVKQIRQDEAQRVFGERLAEFSRRCPRVHKWRQTTGSKMTFRYASLDDIDAQIRPILGELGIAISFDSAMLDGIMSVTVRIRVGSYFEDRQFGCPIPRDMPVTDAQKFGAALSYAKRYALCAALNIVVTDEDNESNLGAVITPEQVQDLEYLLSDTHSDRAAFLAWAGVKTLAEMPATKFGQAHGMLMKKAKGGAK